MSNINTYRKMTDTQLIFRVLYEILMKMAPAGVEYNKLASELTKRAFEKKEDWVDGG